MLTAHRIERLIRPLVGAALGFVLIGTAQAADQTGVRLNEVLRSVFFAPQYVAFSIGAFKAEGLEVDGPKTTWGTQATLTEVVSGASNIALQGPEAASYTLEAGPERRLVDFARLTNGDGSFILAKTQMPRFQLSDLKGKTIVTSGKGSTPALVLEHLLRRAGLDPAKDLNIRNIPTSANIIPSFLDASADFAQVIEPAATVGVRQKGAFQVATVSGLLGPVPYTVYMAPAAYIEKNPGVIQAFTNGIYRALIWTDQHSPVQIAEAIAPYFKDLDRDILVGVVTQYKATRIWAVDPRIDPEGLDRMIDLVIEGGILKSKVTYGQIVDPRFADRAVQTIRQ
jgi:NitT/TauT family transport system substrate-binding protein